MEKESTTSLSAVRMQVPPEDDPDTIMDVLHLRGKLGEYASEISRLKAVLQDKDHLIASRDLHTATLEGQVVAYQDMLNHMVEKMLGNG